MFDVNMLKELGHHCFLQWLVACSMPCYYLIQCCLIANLTIGDTFQWNSNRNTIIPIQEKLIWKCCFQNGDHFVYSRPQCADWLHSLSMNGITDHTVGNCFELIVMNYHTPIKYHWHYLNDALHTSIISTDYSTFIYFVSIITYCNWPLSKVNIMQHIDGLVEARHNSSALTMKLHLSCTNPSIWNVEIQKYTLLKK